MNIQTIYTEKYSKMAYPYKKFGQKSAPKADSAANKYKNYQWGTIAVTVQPGKGNDILIIFVNSKLF